MRTGMKHGASDGKKETNFDETKLSGEATEKSLREENEAFQVIQAFSGPSC